MPSEKSSETASPVVEREIGGVTYICKKMPAEAGLALFLRVSRTLSGARGLFEAIALGDTDFELLNQFFDFTEKMDPADVQALVVDLAKLPTKEDGSPPEAADIRELLELAFFAIGVNFHDFLPVSPSGMFIRADRDESEETSQTPKSTD
jgi:hypothetical protein